MSSAKVPLLNDDEVVQFGEEEENISNKYKHPFVAFFHLFFRISALVVYNLCSLFNISFITSFVVVMLLLSMDFWTVKNITGRLLVGLRWWNYIDEDGQSHWVFESKKSIKQSRIQAAEARLFWLALILVPCVWIIQFIIAFVGFSFRWLLLVSIALSLSGANLYGYVKCKLGTKESLTSSISNISSQFFKRQLIRNVANMMTGKETATGATNVV